MFLGGLPIARRKRRSQTGSRRLHSHARCSCQHALRPIQQRRHRSATTAISALVSGWVGCTILLVLDIPPCDASMRKNVHQLMAKQKRPHHQHHQR